MPCRARAALVAALAVATLACAKTGAATTADSAGARAAAADTGRAGYDTVLLRRVDLARLTGDTTAPVWMIEVSDFQCPYCKRWHDETWPALERKYVRTGKLRVAFLNLPLPGHRNAWPAAEAAMCAGAQGKFWPYHDSLFVAQGRWSELARPDSLFARVAAAVGADTASWRRCTESHATRPLVQGDKDRVTAAGVASTPTFFVGDTVIEGAYPLADFERAIDAQLAKKARATTRK